MRRVHELMKWVRSGEYDRIMAGEYCAAATKADAREEAGDAAEYYADKFRTIFKEAGEGVGKVGDKAGEAADKLSDWLKQQVVRRHRLGEVVALRDVAAQVAQRGRLLGGLDALGHRAARRARGRAG